MPVRSSTSGRSTDDTGTPASWRATWGASSSELTRASTAIDDGATPGSPSQPSTTDDQRGGAVVAPVLDDAQRAGRRVAGRAGVDLLGDPAVVVAEQRAGAVDDLDRAAVVDGQRVGDGAGEQPLVVDEERRVGAGVAVDALVVVADAEHVERRQRQQAHEQHVGRREVLELVDEEVAARALHRAAERAVGEQHLDGAVDLLVEVDGAAPGELLAEAPGTARPGRARRRATPRRRSGSVRPRRIDVRPSTYGPIGIGVGPPLALAGEQRIDEAADLGLVDHRRRPAAVLGQHPQAERVERADPRPEVGGAGLHLELGLLVVGDGEHAGRLVAAVEVEVAQALGEDARLARAGRGDDPGRAAGVGDGGQLVGRQVGAGRDVVAGRRRASRGRPSRCARRSTRRAPACGDRRRSTPACRRAG